MRGLLLLAIIKVVVGQERTTEGSWETVTYNPGIGCLPYDGSIVPDCSKYVDPITKQPFFKEHSSSKEKYYTSNGVLLTRRGIILYAHLILVCPMSSVCHIH